MEEEGMGSDVDNWLKKEGQEFLKGIGMKEGQTVLDFGCGEGHYAIPAAKLVGRKGRVYAVDKDEQALHRLTQTMDANSINNIKVIKEDTKVPVENDQMDFIVCYDVIHYVKDRKNLYHELHRVLRQEGILSLYPKHLKNDYPLMELSHMRLEDVIEEVEDAGFSLKGKFLKKLIHDDSYDKGFILNFIKN